MDRRYEVSLSFDVQEIREDGAVPFFDNVLNYHNLPYGAMVGIEAMLVEMLSKLTEIGLTKAQNANGSEVLDALVGTGTQEKVQPFHTIRK